MIILSSPSGAGKTTLVKLISEKKLEAVKTHFQEDWKYIQSIATPTSLQTRQP